MVDEPMADVVARVLRHDAAAPGQCWYVDATEPAYPRVREDDGLPGGALVADLVTQANAALIADFRTDAVTLAREVERLTALTAEVAELRTELAYVREGREAYRVEVEDLVKAKADVVERLNVEIQEGAEEIRRARSIESIPGNRAVPEEEETPAVSEFCGSCRFWLPPEPDRSVSVTGPMLDSQGRCRRRAPWPEKWIETRMNWPRSDAGDWCGEYEERV